MDELHKGQLQVMETFFAPVEMHQGIGGGVPDQGEHVGSGHRIHHLPHRPHHQHQEPQGAEDQEGHGCSHAGRHGHHSQDHHHEHLHHHKDHHSADMTCIHPHTDVFTHAHASATPPSIISSSSSTSSSSSSSSWSSEASIQNEAFLVASRRKLRHTLHSQSCVDKGRRGDEEDEEDEKDTRPLLSDDCHLSKSASLEQSLISGDNPEIPESRKPKKAVSYIQLSTRSVWKNKRGLGGGVGKGENLRKAKSMEAISSRDESSAFGALGGGVGGGVEARQNLLKEKLRFSVFLNEITRQVLSPSRLSSLGVTNAQRPASPKSPREERRGQDYRQVGGRPRQQTNKPGSPDSIASSAHFHCSGYSRSSQHQHDRHHCATCATPQLQCCTSGSRTDASISPDNSPSLKQGQVLTGGKQHHAGSNNPLTEDTNTSPEISPSLSKHHSQHSHGDHQCNINAQHSPPDHPDQPKHAHHHQRNINAQYSPPDHPDQPKHAHHHQRNINALHSHPDHPDQPKHVQLHQRNINAQHLSPNHPDQPKHVQLHQRNINAQHLSPNHPDQPKHAHCSTGQSDVSPGISVTLQESHPSRLDSPQNMASPEPKQVTEEQCPDVTSEGNRMQILQKQTENLRRSLLQTTMRMNCMGMEFKTSHQQLEVDLLRTQLDLENLKDKFKRFQDTYSSTQQRNQLWEQKLQTVSQQIGGERERLSKSILELTEQLATAHTAIQSQEIINEASGKRFEAEEAANKFLFSVPSPPAQFMDNDQYNKTLGTGDNQALRPVLEEEESDWSKSGEGIQRGAAKGPGGGQPSVTAFMSWIQEKEQGGSVGPLKQGEVVSESGRDKGVSPAPPCSLQIPHLQFTLYPKTLSVPTADVSPARFTTVPDGLAGQGYGDAAMSKLDPPVRVLSASLGEIRPTGVNQHHSSPPVPNCTEAVTSLRRPQGGALGDPDEDDTFCNWRKSKGKECGGGCGDVGDYSEPGANLLSGQAAPRVGSHLVCQLQPLEMETQGWTEEVTEEVLNGERTQL